MLCQTAIARILIVITLIVTAHAIKPFSVKNISSHFLYSSRSLAFILPDSMRSGFDRANQLALTLSNSLFSGDRMASTVVIAKQPDTFADLPPEEIAKAEVPVKWAKVSLKRKLIVDRSIKTFEPVPVVLPAVMPISLPVFYLSQECAYQKGIRSFRRDMFPLTPQRIRLIYEPKKSDCEKLKKKIEMVALIEEARKKQKYEWTKMECKDGTKESKEKDYPATETQERSSDIQDFSNETDELTQFFR
jgi:hypothetical protein